MTTQTEPNKADTNEHVRQDGKKLQTLNPTQRATGNGIKLGAGEIVLPKEEHSDYLSSVKLSALRTHIQVTLCGLNRLVLD